MKCKKCGAEIPEDSVFCPECGVKIESVVDNQLSTSSPIEENSWAIDPNKPALDKSHKWILGVCSGEAQYLAQKKGWNYKVLLYLFRLCLVVLSTPFTDFIGIIGYIIFYYIYKRNTIIK